MTEGHTTPYLDMLRANVPSARVEIIPDTGHFPQIDDATQVNELQDGFIGSLRAAESHTKASQGSISYRIRPKSGP